MIIYNRKIYKIYLAILNSKTYKKDFHKDYWYLVKSLSTKPENFCLKFLHVKDTNSIRDGENALYLLSSTDF